MPNWRRAFSRLRTFLRPSRAERDLAREVAAHLALIEEEYRRRGLSPEEARLAARHAFGGVEQAKEAQRDARSFIWLEQLRQDIRYTCRSLARTPGFTLVAVVTLALGIGANTAIFSAVNAILLRGLPYKNADRLIRFMETTSPAPGIPPITHPVPFSKADLDAMRAESQTVSNLGVYLPAAGTLTNRDRALRLEGIQISPPVMQALGEAPLIGRLFESDEEDPGRDGALIISYGIWRTDFGSDPQVIGKLVSLDGAAYSVVGVMPPGFRDDVQFWIPFVWRGRGQASRRGGPPPPPRLAIMGRLRDGVSLLAATTEINRIIAERRPLTAGIGSVAQSAGPRASPGVPPPPRPATAAPTSSPPRSARVTAASPGPIELVRLQDEVAAPVRPALLIVAVAAGFVLLIACANVVGLLSVRGVMRASELAVRRALGATRARLIRQGLVECLLLGSIGGALGIGLALASMPMLRWLGADLPTTGLAPVFGLPWISAAAIDRNVLLFAVGASLLASMFCGIAPAIRQGRANELDALRQHGTAQEGLRLFRTQRLRACLLIGEIALTMMLLVGGGLLIRSLHRLVTTDPGFDPSNVWTFQVALPAEESRVAFRTTLASRLGALPGVSSVGFAQGLPMAAGAFGTVALRSTLRLPAAPPPPAPGGSTLPQYPMLRIVSRELVRTLGMRVVDGRNFDTSDRPGSPQVMLINRRLAESGFLGPHPIGKLVFAIGPAPWEVVGIVDDVRQVGLDVNPGPQVFIEMEQFPAAGAPGFPPVSFVVRTRSAQAAVVTSQIRQIVRQLDRRATVTGLMPLTQIVSDSVVRQRFAAVLLGSFAGLALLLALVGLYGVMAYLVTRRTHEIGLRMALGARRVDVLALVLRETLSLTAVGVVIGIAGAAASSRVLATLLFDVGPLDARTFLAAAVVFAATAALAAFVPARRAIAVDPASALRYE